MIVTTHSMEECDALASRIGIMAQGQLVCLETSQHLKYQFASRYSLQVKTKPGQSTQVGTWIQQIFPCAKITDTHGDIFSFFFL